MPPMQLLYNAMGMKKRERGRMGGREAGMQRDTTAFNLDLYSLGNVKDEVNIGIVVVV